MLGVVVAATLWTFLWWIIGIVLWALFIYFTFMIAASKGRSPLLWVILDNKSALPSVGKAVHIKQHQL